MPPFVHKFRTETQTYLFDVNTGHILRAPPVAWHIIDKFGVISRDDLVRQFSGRFAANDVAAAWEAIAHAQSGQLLLPRFPERLALTPKADIQAAAQDKCQGLVLNVTEDCNGRCTYCVYSGRYPDWRRHGPRYMVWEVAQAALDDYLRHSTHQRSDRRQGRYVDFYGGEPLLNFPLIARAVQYVRQQPRTDDIAFNVTTNGFLLTGSVADFLAAEEVGVHVSLDGPRHIHDRCRRRRNGGPTWDTVVTHLLDFIRKHPSYESNGRLRINCTLAAPTDAREVGTFFAGHRVFARIPCEVATVYTGRTTRRRSDRVERRPVRGMRALKNQYLECLRAGAIQARPDDPQFQVPRRLFDRSFAVIHNRPVAGPGHVLPERTGSRVLCIPGVLQTFVTVAGDYYPCETVPPLECLRVGNVRSGRDLEAIYGLVQEFQRLNEAECLKCWCVRNCHAGCYSTLIEAGGLTEDVKRDTCARYREHMHDTLVSYCAIQEANPHAFDYLRGAPPLAHPRPAQDPS